MVNARETQDNRNPNSVQDSSVGYSRGRIWAGWILSALLGLFLLSSGVNVARQASFVMSTFAHLGYSENVALGIGVTEFVCAALYLFPRTAFLGTVLLTGYLGGATASHVRVGDALLPPVVIGVLVWVGLLLRDRRFSSYAFRIFEPAGGK